MSQQCDLTNKSCKPCEGGVPVIEQAQAQEMLSQLQDWELQQQATWLFKRFEFSDFYHTMAFVNAVAYIANQEGHHPDLTMSYGFCEVRWQTHAIGGLSENDFICAAKVDLL